MTSDAIPVKVVQSAHQSMKSLSHSGLNPNSLSPTVRRFSRVAMAKQELAHATRLSLEITFENLFNGYRNLEQAGYRKPSNEAHANKIVTSTIKEMIPYLNSGSSNKHVLNQKSRILLELAKQALRGSPTELLIYNFISTYWIEKTEEGMKCLISPSLIIYAYLKHTECLQANYLKIVYSNPPLEEPTSQNAIETLNTIESNLTKTEEILKQLFNINADQLKNWDALLDFTKSYDFEETHNIIRSRIYDIIVNKYNEMVEKVVDEEQSKEGSVQQQSMLHMYSEASKTTLPMSCAAEYHQENAHPLRASVRV